MAKVLGLNAVFHDPASALVVDGTTVAAAEEERFSRRKHGKRPVPFSTWELPELSARWCLQHAGLGPHDLDAVAYSYDPSRAPQNANLIADGWEGLRTLYAKRAPHFVAAALGVNPDRFVFVPHHIAHAASAYMCAPFESCAVMTLDGRGERTSYLAGHAHEDRLSVLQEQSLPHSLGVLYEEVTEHLGFQRSSDEYKVMALAAYGRPSFIDLFRASVTTDGAGGFRTSTPDLGLLAKRLQPGDAWQQEHADLAATMQARLEEVVLELARWLHDHIGERCLAMAGGVALNCVANTRLWREAPFDEIWVQPAAGDSGTALGAALHVAHSMGDLVEPFDTPALGYGPTDGEIEDALRTAKIPYERPPDIASEVAEALARDEIVAWYQGRSEWGPRALGHRSLLANPTNLNNVARLNNVKGREQFRPVAPMVLDRRAADIFDGPLPSPYMLFTHRVADGWRDRIAAVVHVDGTARIQSVNEDAEPLVASMLLHFERITGVPVVVNTSLNTAGRPMVDSVRDVLECFGSTPVDLLAAGPFIVRRAGSVGRQ